MNRNQILGAGLASLAEMGLIDLKSPSPQQNQIGTVALWSMATRDLSDAELKAGFDGLIANSTSDFNKRVLPGDLRKYVNKHTALNHGQMFDDIMANAYKAMYGEFNGKSGVVEYYKFNPLVTSAIKQMGGLSVFLTMEETELNTFRAQFRDIVNAINEKEAQKHIVKPVLDSRAAIEAQSKPVMMIEAKEQEPTEPQDPRVKEAFAAVRAKFEQRKMQEEQAVKLAAINMLKALSNG